MQPRIAVFGASGYTGVELTRLVDGHPDVELVVASSDRWVGEALSAKVGGRSELRYVGLDEAIVQAKDCDIVMLATPAEASHDLVPQLLEHARVIDLSGAYRLKQPQVYGKFYGFVHQHTELLEQAVYGLPELFRRRIAGARLVANPGCYATAIQLALAPLMQSTQTEAPTTMRSSSDDVTTTRPFARSGSGDQMLQRGRLIVDAMSGVTGAGRKASEEYSFAEIAGDLRAYRVLRHQHEPEIEQGLSELAGREIDVTFVPHLLPVSRGIVATCHAQLAGPHDVMYAYKTFYGQERFVTLAPSAEQVALHDVVGTNQCRIGIAVGDHHELVIVAAIDNLVKGAAGQAVQNLNLLLGLDEQAGLRNLRSFHP